MREDIRGVMWQINQNDDINGFHGLGVVITPLTKQPSKRTFWSALWMRPTNNMHLHGAATTNSHVDHEQKYRDALLKDLKDNISNVQNWMKLQHDCHQGEHISMLSAVYI